MDKGHKIPRYFRITSRGKWFIFVTIAVGAAAINTGHNLIYLCLALNLSLLITSGMLSDLATRRILIEIDRGSVHHAGEKGSTLLLTLRNEKRILPLFFVKIFLHIEGNVFEGEVEHVPPGESRKKFVRVKFRRRGVKTIRRVTVMTRFPFGFFEKYYHVRSSIKLIVAPDPESHPLPETSTRHQKDLEGDLLRTNSFAEGHSIRDVREYLPSDPMKLIMWKKYAERGELYVRIPEDEIPPHARIEIRGNQNVSLFEEFLRRVAATIEYLRTHRIPFELVYEDHVIECNLTDESIRKAIASLALVGNDGRMKPWLKTLEELTG